MDQVLADTLTANLKAAKTPDEVSRAQTLALIALVDCQRKTAERVKIMFIAHDRVSWAGRCLCGFVAAGGFTALVWVLKHMGAL